MSQRAGPKRHIVASGFIVLAALTALAALIWAPTSPAYAYDKLVLNAHAHAGARAAAASDELPEADRPRVPARTMPTLVRNGVATETGLAESGTIDANSVRFSQNSISATFRDGGSVKGLTADLESGAVQPGDVEPIRVFERDGNIYSLDNRRLAAFQQAGIDVPYRLATPEEIAQEGWKLTRTNDGTSVVIRGGG